MIRDAPIDEVALSDTEATLKSEIYNYKLAKSYFDRKEYDR